MPRLVTVNVDNVILAGAERDSGDQVEISDDEFTALTNAGRFTDGTLTDGGVSGSDGDEVFDQVAAPAVTSTDAAGATPTDAEFNALRADLLALRTALTGAGRPLA